MSTSWLQHPAKTPDNSQRLGAELRQGQLTKPPGSLGMLEEMAIRLAAMQGRINPALDDVRIVIFAADHGVVTEGVSAFPQSVTVEMLRNFTRGGAAISVLARHLGADLQVVNVGTATRPTDIPDVVDRHVAAGTANFCHHPAMTEAQLLRALDAGREAATLAHETGSQLFIGGEMGIGNTTAASAIAAALLGQSAAALVGAGTGLDHHGIRRKISVVERALATHRDELHDPLAVLRCLGGLEIAALTGAYVHCAQVGLPVLVDGFITGSAALLAARLCPASPDWFFYAHNSAEPGHALILAALEARPLLQLGLRLGEASGAAAAVPLLRMAVSLHNEMATFSEAGVSAAVNE